MESASPERLIIDLRRNGGGDNFSTLGAAMNANAANTGGVAESALSCASGGTNPDYEGYGYDANGNRTSLRLRSTETIVYTYDNLSRETLKDIPGGTGADVYAAYDLAGRRLSARFASAAGQGVIYAYDSAGRLASETSTIGTSRALSYQYDAASNRTRVTWPDAFFASYTYDALNRVDLVQENGATTLADYAYDDRAFIAETTPQQDAGVLGAAADFQESHPTYDVLGCNCGDYVQQSVSTVDPNFPVTVNPAATVPHMQSPGSGWSAVPGKEPPAPPPRPDDLRRDENGNFMLR